jgi:hypothetical protein
MNEPAFPNEGFNGWGKPFEGMTLRDYFAAKAMPVAMETLRQDWTKDLGEEWYWNHSELEILAEHSYYLADAMLKARGE